ncbi:MAG TPA: thiol:disulfide interchange protein DsbA/DsbL [Burkholderiales bacterium]|nr:thiol:disulfide interchange protein DsbA/DsbL [Burkholderiales bacterium]
MTAHRNIDMLRRRLLLAGSGAALFGGLLQHAAAAPVAGRNYTVLDPALPVESPDKIEVIEFFWYGCPHCYNLQPYMEKWIPTLPADTMLRRVPAIFNDRWARDAATYYAFEALGVVERVHRPFFDAIHRDRLKSDNKQAMHEWLRKQDIDPQKFDQALTSFGVGSKVKRAMQLTAGYRIDGTPSLAVQGRYRISAGQASSQEDLLATATYLIGLVRQGAAQKK